MPIRIIMFFPFMKMKSNLVAMNLVAAVSVLVLSGCQTSSKWENPKSPPINESSYLPDTGDLQRISYESFKEDVNYAIQDPVIKARFPNLILEVGNSLESAAYKPLTGGFGGHSITGESYQFRLRENNRTLASVGSTSGLSNMERSDAFFKVGDAYEGYDLFVQLFRQAPFTQEEFAKLSQSKVSEVRYAAAVNLTDPNMLAMLAAGDKSSGVRKAAIENPNLTDHEVLAKILNDDDQPVIRVAAAKKLADLIFASNLAAEPTSSIGASNSTTNTVAGGRNRLVCKNVRWKIR
jgi:hypothetical protein